MTDTTGKRLKSARMAMKISQFKLSQQVASSQAMIALYEGDKAPIPYEKLRDIAQVLGVDIEWLSVDKYKANDEIQVVKSVNEQNLTLSKRLVATLQRANMTVEQLSSLTDIPLKVLSAIMEDKESARVVHIVAICAALNIDKSWLAFGSK